jgi:hypothetical protein
MVLHVKAGSISLLLHVAGRCFFSEVQEPKTNILIGLVYLMQDYFSNPASIIHSPIKWKKFTSSLSVIFYFMFFRLYVIFFSSQLSNGICSLLFI